MAVVSDPYESYLKRAAELFDGGDIVQAGQIWQAILKKKPDHEIARAGLYKVKLYFDARATQGGLVHAKPAGPGDVRATAEAPAKTVDPEIVKLLEQGCTLYDAGHVEDALTKWIQVLAKEPDNVLAKGYISGAHRTLGQPAASEGAAAPAVPKVAAEVPVVVAAPAPEVDIDRLLRDGCTLFDMGQMEDALKKWEQILAHDPEHALARAYVQDARKDLGLPLLEEGERPAQAPAALPVAPEAAQGAAQGGDDDRIENLIRDGVQLYDMGMIHEAMERWRQVLVLVPGHRDAEAYLVMATRDQEAPAPTAKPVATPPPSEMSGRDFPGLQARNPQAYQPPAAPLELDEPSVMDDPPASATPSQPVTPPQALISGAQKTRKGFNLPEALQGISLPPWVASPAFILGTIAGLVILVIGSYYYLQHRKDEALRHEVAAFRASATAPVVRSSVIASLQETPGQIRSEAQSALDSDPLLAYFRAQELARLDPGDASVAQLLERAKAGLSKNASEPVTITVFEKQIQNGELDAADRSMTSLLSQNPDDMILRERAARLYVALIRAYVSKESWTEADEHLHRGRAMFPADKTWSTKLQLLKRIQSMAKSDRTPWIQLLG